MHAHQIKSDFRCRKTPRRTPGRYWKPGNLETWKPGNLGQYTDILLVFFKWTLTSPGTTLKKYLSLRSSDTTGAA